MFQRNMGQLEFPQLLSQFNLPGYFKLSGECKTAQNGTLIPVLAARENTLQCSLHAERVLHFNLFDA